MLIPNKDFKVLQHKAALKTKPEKLLFLEDERAYNKSHSQVSTKKLIVKQSTAESTAISVLTLHINAALKIHF
jgi:hypothetical protein